MTYKSARILIGLGLVLALPSMSLFLPVRALAQSTKQVSSQGDVYALTSTISDITKNIFQEKNSENKINQAKERADLMLSLAKKSPSQFLNTVLKDNDRNKRSQDLEQYLEKPVSLTGTLEAITYDDFDHSGNAHTDYFLRVGNEKFPVYTIDEVDMVPGSELRVSGYQIYNVIVAAEKTIVNNHELPTLGKQRTAVILVDFQDSGTRPFTATQAQSLVFQGQMKNFYAEQSYGKTWFTGDVFGWYRLPRNANNTWPEWPDGNNEMANLITSHNIHLDNYDRLVIMVYHPSGFDAAFSSVGKNQLQINGVNYLTSVSYIGYLEHYSEPSFWGSQPFTWTNLDYLLSHELGHGLGLMHASGEDCGEQSMYGECEHVEYGNMFDTMGTESLSLHFNAFYKSILGWFTAADVQTITSSGTYTINALETTQGKRAAKIKIQGTNITPFYLEYRKAIGFDADLNSSNLTSNQTGLMVNFLPKSSSNMRFSRILDMSPTAQYWFDDAKNATLNSATSEAPPVFNDAGRGITIGPVLSVGTTSITFYVSVDAPLCSRQSPGIVTAPQNMYVAAGWFSGIGMQFSDEDYFGCGVSNFEVTSTIPASWEPSLDPMDPVLSPEDQRFASFSYHVPPSTAPGEYPVIITVKNLNSGMTVSRQAIINVTLGVQEDTPHGVQGLIPSVIDRAVPESPTEERESTLVDNIVDNT